MTSISVAVVDGQRTFADALMSRLAAEPGLLVVAATGSAAAVRSLLIGRHVDVVLLDSELPDCLEVAAELAQVRPDPRPIRVIMLGAVPEAARTVAALRTGVAGWVPKEESIEHLFDVIRGVMRDETRLPATAVGPALRLLLHEHDDGETPWRHPLGNLTRREREILSYLAQGIGRREIAERMHLSAHTVRSHMQNLMGKLEVHSTLEAVALARREQLSQAGLLAVSSPGPSESLQNKERTATRGARESR